MSIHLRLTLALLFEVFFSAWGNAAELKRNLGSIGDLPPYLRFRDGETSYVADYRAKEGGVVPIYVVNATDAPVQHGVFIPMLFRETLCADGTWRRCDSFSQFGCGVGLDESVTIPPRGFLKLHRDLDSTTGKLQKVRFREYTPAGPLPGITNEGEGVVDLNEVRMCRLDTISANSAPFEDLRSLFIGKDAVRSFPYREDALHRLASFVDEPGRVPALKQILHKAKADDDVTTYWSALTGLQLEGAGTWAHEDFWKLALKEFSTAEPKWARAAYSTLRDAPFFADRKRALLEGILANPKHPLLEVALGDFPKIAGNAAATALVERIIESPRYGEDIKKKAGDLRTLLQTNPFLAVWVMPGEPDALDRKTVAITVINVSEEQITLHVKDPLDLLTLTVADPSGRELPQFAHPLAKPASPKTDAEPIVLEPRGSFAFPALHWWDFVDISKVPADVALQFTVCVQSPGLWETPSKVGPFKIPPESVNAARDHQLAELENRSQR